MDLNKSLHENYMSQHDKKLEMWVLIASYRRAVKDFTNVKELYEAADRAEKTFKENTTRVIK